MRSRAMVRGRRMQTKPSERIAARRSMLRSDLLLKLEMESNPEALCLVRATMERATQVLQFQEAESRAIVRSVDEALANVLRHAYKGRTGLPIEVACRRLRGAAKGAGIAGIEIIMRDSGVSLDTAKLKGRSLEEIRPGGLGLHLMRQSMDEVEFSRKKGKNQLRMVKYLVPAAPVISPEGE